jgi:hypothetical protein
LRKSGNSDEWNVYTSGAGSKWKLKELYCEISDPYSSEYKECGLLGCDAV